MALSALGSEEGRRSRRYSAIRIKIGTYCCLAKGSRSLSERGADGTVSQGAITRRREVSRLEAIGTKTSQGLTGTAPGSRGNRSFRTAVLAGAGRVSACRTA